MPRATKPADNLSEPSAPVETPLETPAPPATADPPVKPKKVITEKQREALIKGQETRNANRIARKAENEAKAEIEKKILEEKLVKKAEQIKKKTEKKLAVLDAISDASDDDDENIVKPLESKTRPTAECREKVRPPPTAKPAKTPKPKKTKKVVVIESDDGSTDSEDYARSIDDMDSDEEVVYVAKSHSKKRSKSQPLAVPAKPVIKFI